MIEPIEFIAVLQNREPRILKSKMLELKMLELKIKNLSQKQGVDL